MAVCDRCPAAIRSDNRSGLCHDCWPVVFRENNRTMIRENHKRYRRAEPERLLLSNSKQRSRRLGLEFDLTKDDIHIPARCPFLGIELRCNDGQPKSDSPSLDRIDPTKGYVKGNVRVISHLANRAKTNLTAGQLELMARNVLRERGIRVIDTVENVGCPVCSNPGPHERVGAAQDGSYILARCSGKDCSLEWKVAG